MTTARTRREVRARGGDLFAVVLLALIMPGCAGTKLTRSDELDAVRRSTSATERELVELRQLVNAESERSASQNVEILTQLDRIEVRFDQLTAQLQDLFDGLSLLQSRSARAPSSPSRSSTGGEGATSGGARSGDPSGVYEPDAVVGAGNAEPRAQYEAAYLEVTKGRYDRAIAAFEGFLRAHPENELADNAVYWVGECHYATRDFNRAAEAFVRLIDTYPDGDKVPAAMLKLGFAFQENGDVVAARRYLQALVDEHPKTDEARKARARLAEL